MNLLLPEATTIAGTTDKIVVFLFIISLAFLVFITTLMVVFVVRYSRKRHPKAEQIDGHAALETAWTVIPLLLFLGIFYFGWTGFDYTRRAPRDAMVVKVTGRQWTWAFEYPNGKRTDKLYAVINRPMKVEVTSTDVIHGFYIPAFRIKVDAVPGRTNTTWFEPTRLGTYDIQCTVICGVSHSSMLSHVHTVTEAEFKAWYFGPEGAPEPKVKVAELRSAAPTSVEHEGLALMRPHGCLGCHSTDGKPMVGPTFKGLFGKQEEIVSQGGVRTVTVDEERIRLAILEPSREIVRGYPPQMPSAALTSDELNQVVSYIKELR
jgi:cytochrome c oxidase subunit 2